MRSDWVDPDDVEGLPDEAAVIRELEESRERRRPGFTVWYLLVLIPIVLVFIGLFARQTQRLEWQDLIRAGGGETGYLATDWTCRPFPHPRLGGRAHRRPSLPRGERVGIVARENGWALTGAEGKPCWVPSWALGENPPPRDMAAIRCGRACEPEAPPGWYEAQLAAACSYDMLERFDCLIERLFAPEDRRRNRP